MTQLTTGQVYQLARNAGFSVSGAVIMTAIVAAESGNRSDAIGDQNLTEPGEMSVGLTQINYRPSRDQGSDLRNPTRNLDPQTNLVHAFQISGRGTNWRPWSTYTSGAYVKHLTAARAAAAGGGDTVPALPPSSSGSGGGATAQQAGWGKLLDPLGVGSWLWGHTGGAIVSDAQKSLTQAVVHGAIIVTAFGGGIALVVMGLRELVAPAVDQVKQHVTENAQQAAAIAPLAAAAV